MDEMDKIILKDARYMCNIGITKKERKIKQPIYINMELYRDISQAAKTDNIQDTISYSEVNKHIQGTIENKDFNLIETVAEKVADIILDNYDIQKATIRIKKPEATPYADYAGVQITRIKND